VMTPIAGASAQFLFVLLADGLWHHWSTGESQVFNTAQNGNILQINGTTINAVTGTGSTAALANAPAFTGAVTFADRPWVDPTSPSYGAKCDGSTDDSTSLQAAGNSAVILGSILRIPPGVKCAYATGLSFTVPVQIEGTVEQGANNSAVGGAISTLYYTGTGSALTINNGTSYIYGVHLRNFDIDAPNVSSGTGAGIACTYCNQPTVDNVQVLSTNVPGFTSDFDFSNTAGIICRNCLAANATNAFRLVGATNVDIDACNVYQNNVVFLMGGSNLGVNIHDCTNIEAQNFVLDWDDTNPAASSTVANHITLHHNFMIFDSGSGGGPYNTRQALHVSNHSANTIAVSNLVFSDNAIYCPAANAACLWAFNVAMSNGSSFITLTSERNWIFGWNSGGLTANNAAVTVAWLNNQNLQLSGSPNVDVGGTPTYCVVHYSAGQMTTCPVNAVGTITTSGGLRDPSPATEINRLYFNQAPALNPVNVVLNGWGTGATFSIAGRDSIFAITITAGTSPNPFPFATVSFNNGLWLDGNPYCQVTRGDFTAPSTANVSVGSSNASVTPAFGGTPVTGNTYTFFVSCTSQ
jgi:hypothetical protein